MIDVVYTQAIPSSHRVMTARRKIVATTRIVRKRQPVKRNPVPFGRGRLKQLRVAKAYLLKGVVPMFGLISETTVDNGDEFEVCFTYGGVPQAGPVKDLPVRDVDFRNGIGLDIDQLAIYRNLHETKGVGPDYTLDNILASDVSSKFAIPRHLLIPACAGARRIADQFTKFMSDWVDQLISRKGTDDVEPDKD